MLSRENAFYTFQYSGYVFIPVCSVNLSSAVLTLSFLVSMLFEGPLKPPFTPAIVWFYNFILFLIMPVIRIMSEYDSYCLMLMMRTNKMVICLQTNESLPHSHCMV